MEFTIHQSFLPHLDPDASLEFYSGVLGFEVRLDVGAGDMRFITVGSPNQPDTAIVLQPPTPDPFPATPMTPSTSPSQKECDHMPVEKLPDGTVLLSGGNPQIAKGDGRDPVQAYLDAMPGWKGEIGRRLDALILDEVPDAIQAVRWNSPFYGIEGNGWFFSMHCMTKYVKVTWLNGGDLDPPPPETSKYPAVRYSNIHEDDEIDDDQVRDWVRQAAALPGDETF